MKKVALLVETSRGYGRQLLQGVAQYSQFHGSWSFHITPRDFHQELPRINSWHGDGIIARTEDDLIVHNILRLGLPAVILDPPPTSKISPSAKKRIIQVSPDPVKIARIAADHLLSQGFQKFAFCGMQGRVWSDTREKNFVQYLKEQGHSCTVYTPPHRKKISRWESEQPVLAKWLQSLPKPVGIMTCDDIRGRQVLDTCALAGLNVPQEAAVISVDNDELFCELCNPPLSSIALDVSRAGFKLAELLDRMMQTHSPGPEHFSVEPLYVVERQSTNVLVVSDPAVAEALAFIRHKPLHPITVSDVVNKANVSRRTLEIRFRRSVGRPIHSEIQRIRLNHVRRLLLETELPLEKITKLSGFTSPSYLSATFRKHWKTTPLEYRRKHKQ